MLQEHTQRSLAASRLSAHGTSPELGQYVSNGGIKTSNTASVQIYGTVNLFGTDLLLLCHATCQMSMESLLLGLNVKFLPDFFYFSSSP